jgi:hypothetical protein
VVSLVKYSTNARGQPGDDFPALAELPLPALHAVDERLVVAGELEPHLGAAGGEVDAALLARHRHRLDTLRVHQATVTARALTSQA